MVECKICGNQNQDMAKFCTGCGSVLEHPEGTPNIRNATTISKETTVQLSPSKNRAKVIIVSMLFFLGMGVGAYFLFMKKNKKLEKDNANQIEIVSDNKNKVDNQPMHSTDLPQAEPSNPVPVALPSSNELSISQEEITSISQRLQTFYSCENNEDVTCLLKHYKFPVERYYQLYNVSQEKLNKLFSESFSEKLVYHNITIHWNTGTIQKILGGYKTILFADYYFKRKNSPDVPRNRSIQIVIYMDNMYQITTIYEEQ